MHISAGTAFGKTLAGARLSAEEFVPSAVKRFGAHAAAVGVVEPLLQFVGALAGLRGALALAGLFVVESDPQVGAVVAPRRALGETVDEGSGGRPPSVVDVDLEGVAAADQGRLLEGHLVG